MRWQILFDAELTDATPEQCAALGERVVAALQDAGLTGIGCQYRMLDTGETPGRPQLRQRPESLNEISGIVVHALRRKP